MEHATLWCSEDVRIVEAILNCMRSFALSPCIFFERLENFEHCHGP